MGDQHGSARTLAGSARDGSLADKVAWLRGRLGAADEAIETHFAWVFLVGDRAWKLRKPVGRDPMDYSTLDARRRGSEAEVRLNRRLAPRVYLGLRPLTRRPDGQFAIGGAGVVVDWLVEMRRLDRRRMLDAMLASGEATEAELHPVVELLGDFYAHEPPAVADGAALDARRDWLDARAAGGCVVEAHGDLRPEHVQLARPAAVIDCLEFDRNLRILDRAEELEFLAMECARIGHAGAGAWLARACLRQLHDDAPAPLRSFYRSHRAGTRAKLYAWRAGEPDGGDIEHWMATARGYLSLALESARLAAR